MCKKSSTHFFNEIELQLLTDTSDVIIPGTSELPKASDVGVAEYMDHYIADIVEEDEQKNLKSFMQQYVRAINPEKPIEYWVEQSFRRIGKLKNPGKKKSITMKNYSLMVQWLPFLMK